MRDPIVTRSLDTNTSFSPSPDAANITDRTRRGPTTTRADISQNDMDATKKPARNRLDDQRLQPGSLRMRTQREHRKPPTRRPKLGTTKIHPQINTCSLAPHPVPSVTRSHAFCVETSKRNDGFGTPSGRRTRYLRWQLPNTPDRTETVRLSERAPSSSAESQVDHAKKKWRRLSLPMTAMSSDPRESVR
jgi:hypothetical protein